MPIIALVRWEADKPGTQSLDPGNLKTNLQRNFSNDQGRIANFLLGFILHPAIKGAYTELYAGFSPELTMEKCKDPAWWGEMPLPYS
jgi:retinol dehydrogenase 12